MIKEAACKSSEKNITIKYHGRCKENVKECTDEFFKIEGAVWPFKIFTEAKRTWFEAKTKCEEEQLSLAYDTNKFARKLRKYILDNCGDVPVWLDARGDGFNFIWQKNKKELSRRNVLWLPGNPTWLFDTNYEYPGRKRSTKDHCLSLEVLQNKWSHHPAHPYASHKCLTKQYTLCQETRPAIIPSEDDGCGLATRFYVIGGEETSPGDWPWLAAIMLTDARHGDLVVGLGTLITNQHVISAAHIFNHPDFKNFTVRLGEYNLTSVEDDGAVQVFDIVDRRMGNRENDIILLKLDRPVNSFTDRIRPACLPYHLRNYNFEGSTLTSVGWGRTSYYDILAVEMAQIPSQGYVSVVPLQGCIEIYGNHPISNKQICAGKLTATCNGDAGGPLNYADTQTGRFYVVGIVSFGPTLCGNNGFPAVYTRVGSFLDWIDEKIIELL
ncbi:unnamed protein product [Meganyctiphanes norvegica]|uniref:Uncharacterized protein n=1 Tax=Meganyctiphanes norvegica TaxID=48144 RepID=A0AAV2Q9N1_MEGNR